MGTKVKMNGMPMTTPKEAVSPTESAVAVYRPELDALRFLAFLLVFFHHTNLHVRGLIDLRAAGQFGVCLFFMLSAYLITDLLWRERERTGDIHIPSFYTRRILRIWPLYFAFMGLCAILGRFVPSWPLEPARVAAFVLLAGNWYAGRFGWTRNPIGPLWSISIEEQFYLIMPQVAKRFGKSAIVCLSLLTFVAAYVVLWWLGVHHVPADPSVWTNSLVQFQFFGAGCILATILKGAVPTIANPIRPLLAAAGIGAWLLAARSGITEPVVAGAGSLCEGYALVLVGTVLLFIAFLGTTVRIPKFIAYLGKISYGLYVFHVLVMYSIGFTADLKDGPPWKIVRGAVSFILTVALASLSYEYFEKPFLKLKKRFTYVASRAE